jgi:hypothetical protein
MPLIGIVAVRGRCWRISSTSCRLANNDLRGGRRHTKPSAFAVSTFGFGNPSPPDSSAGSRRLGLPPSYARGTTTIVEARAAISRLLTRSNQAWGRIERRGVSPPDLLCLARESSPNQLAFSYDFVHTKRTPRADGVRHTHRTPKSTAHWSPIQFSDAEHTSRLMTLCRRALLV